MIKTMILFHSIPESTECVVVDLTQEQFDVLKKANGVYDGLDIDYTREQYDANRAISEALVEASRDDLRVHADRDGFGQWFGLFGDKRVKIENHNEPLDITGVQFMINTGYIM